jgi:hypothetical protein
MLGTGEQSMRTQQQQRPRRYVSRHWLVALKPVLRYSATRDAFVLRAIGSSSGPVLRVDRRKARLAQHSGVERRGARTA